MRTRAPLLVIAVLVTLAPPLHAASDGGWLSPASISGIEGSYTRAPFSHAPIAFVTLRGSDDGTRADGTYTRFSDGGDGLITLQQGNYIALANNPAIGADIVFYDANGVAGDAYFILGIRRDVLGRSITALELADPRDGSAFVLTRVGL